MGFLAPWFLAGAAAGMVGVSVVKLTVSSDAVSGNLNFSVTANGKSSTAMLLPIQ